MDKAHAHHDLNGVELLEISCWPGPHEVLSRDDGNAWVTIEAPKRHPDEYWTFAATRDGVLTCHSDLVGSPALAGSGADQILTVRMPPAKFRVVRVQLGG